MAFNTPVADRGTGSLAEAAAAAARAPAVAPTVSKCGRDCRSCERRSGCAAFMIDFSNLGR